MACGETRKDETTEVKVEANVDQGKQRLDG